MDTKGGSRHREDWMEKGRELEQEMHTMGRNVGQKENWIWAGEESNMRKTASRLRTIPYPQ